MAAGGPPLPSATSLGSRTSITKGSFRPWGLPRWDQCPTVCRFGRQGLVPGVPKTDALFMDHIGDGITSDHPSLTILSSIDQTCITDVLLPQVGATIGWSTFTTMYGWTLEVPMNNLYVPPCLTTIIVTIVCQDHHLPSFYTTLQHFYESWTIITNNHHSSWVTSHHSPTIHHPGTSTDISAAWRTSAVAFSTMALVRRGSRVFSPLSRCRWGWLAEVNEKGRKETRKNDCYLEMSIIYK